MNNIQTKKEYLFTRWQSLRIYNIVILFTFLFFYCLGTLQSYSFFTSTAVFNLPLILPLSAIFLCAYLIHCLINRKYLQSRLLIPILTLFTTLFITINSHFETDTSLNSFLYFSLLLPVFHAFLLCYHFKLLLANNVIIIISYSFTAIIGNTSPLVFTFNVVFLLTLVFITIYSHLQNMAYSSKNSTTNTVKTPALSDKDSAYLKSMIHDIRQPLSSLSLYSHLLNDKSTDPQQKLLIKNLVSASTQLDHWLSSLLELAALNAKGRQPNLNNIPLETCLSVVIKQYKIQVALQGIKLKVRFTKTALYTDSKLLSDIVENLLSNALLHGSQKNGGVILLTARHQQGSINIQVWNKGPRINSEQLNSLFDELYHAKNSQHNKSKGPGLGLALAQRKALLLNTSIKVTTSDNGSCFSILIPKGVKKEVVTPLRQESNQRILLVDDDSSILVALSMLLTKWGYSVSCAESSKQAIHLLEITKFSLIISDYRLPGDKNGFDLIKLAQQKQEIPSLLLTGDIEPINLQEEGVRADNILHKPIKPAKLRLLLRQLLAT